jgi:hypothetical protein
MFMTVKHELFGCSARSFVGERDWAVVAKRPRFRQIGGGSGGKLSQSVL